MLIPMSKANPGSDSSEDALKTKENQTSDKFYWMFNKGGVKVPVPADKAAYLYEKKKFVYAEFEDKDRRIPKLCIEECTTKDYPEIQTPIDQLAQTMKQFVEATNSNAESVQAMLLEMMRQKEDEKKDKIK